MDTIFIERLTVDTVIGLYDWEREIRQRVVFDLAMDVDIRTAAATDNVSHTLDYNALTQRIVAFVETSAFQLVETLAERTAAVILDEFPVERVSLSLNKPHALRHAQGVGVRITRERQS